MAGTYIDGRRRQHGARRRPGAQHAGIVKVAAGIEVCLRDAHPGYITWEDFMANQGRLADNVIRYDAGRVGVPRKGRALLQGIASCGRCSRRMSLRDTGPNADYPVHCCRVDRNQGGPVCQEVRALSVDGFVERLLLDALAPDSVSIAIAALAEIDAEARQLEQQWALRKERARFEAERARRQYDAVEPENRSMARSLERAWEERLRAFDAVEQEHARWQREEPIVLGETEHATGQLVPDR